MKNTKTYVGRYKDEEQELDIEIINDSYELSFSINDVRFISSDMEEWQLDNSIEYSDKQLASFALSSVTSKEGFNLVTKYHLTDCTLSFTIPQPTLCKKTAEEALSDLKISINLDREKTIIDLNIHIGEKDIVVDNIEYFEAGLSKINKEIDKTHILFNCFNCRYSSYNVYGQGMFGGLLCYKNHKKQFLAVQDKASYLKVQEQGYEMVQETSYCEEFQLPDKDQFLYK